MLNYFNGDVFLFIKVSCLPTCRINVTRIACGGTVSLRLISHFRFHNISLPKEKRSNVLKIYGKHIRLIILDMVYQFYHKFSNIKRQRYSNNNYSKPRRMSRLVI